MLSKEILGACVVERAFKLTKDFVLHQNWLRHGNVKPLRGWMENGDADPAIDWLITDLLEKISRQLLLELPDFRSYGNFNIKNRQAQLDFNLNQRHFEGDVKTPIHVSPWQILEDQYGSNKLKEQKVEAEDYLQRSSFNGKFRRILSRHSNDIMLAFSDNWHAMNDFMEVTRTIPIRDHAPIIFGRDVNVEIDPKKQPKLIKFAGRRYPEVRGLLECFRSGSTDMLQIYTFDFYWPYNMNRNKPEDDHEPVAFIWLRDGGTYRLDICITRYHYEYYWHQYPKKFKLRPKILFSEIGHTPVPLDTEFKGSIKDLVSSFKKQLGAFLSPAADFIHEYERLLAQREVRGIRKWYPGGRPPNPGYYIKSGWIPHDHEKEKFEEGLCGPFLRIVRLVVCARYSPKGYTGHRTLERNVGASGRYFRDVDDSVLFGLCDFTRSGYF